MYDAPPSHRLALPIVCSVNMNFKKAHVAAHKAARSVLRNQYSYRSSVWSDASSGNTLKSRGEAGANGRPFLKERGGQKRENFAAEAIRHD